MERNVENNLNMENHTNQVLDSQTGLDGDSSAVWPIARIWAILDKFKEIKVVSKAAIAETESGSLEQRGQFLCVKSVAHTLNSQKTPLPFDLRYSYDFLFSCSGDRHRSITIGSSRWMLNC
ncbi:hypothetical protein R1flu_026969 [Riccia fluitans]|uniref:Uncharacterized protein n=1 Tax=Riccia fluitans TaxID=41844 RepID=A0ABD1XKH6_9MARC